MKRFSLAGIIALLPLLGCGADQSPSNMPTAPVPAATLTPEHAPGKGPGYEPAWYDGRLVTINAIEVPNHAPLQAQADLYEVVYPIGWEGMGLAPPQCSPCDHQGDGIDFTDFHDHTLDSIPGSPGKGEYSPLWHVYVVVPAYNHDPAHDAAVSAAYAAHMPASSEEAVDALLASQLPGGGPVAVEIDTNFYFLCSVVNANAAK